VVKLPAGQPGSKAEESAPAVPRRVAVQLLAPLVDGLAEFVNTVQEVAALGVDLIAVVPSRTAQPRLRPIDVTLHLQQHVSIPTMATVTTWDRAGSALQADLLGAHALGLRQVVCETGSPPLRGDYPHADGVWDLDSIGLVGLLRGLNEGRDHYGLPVPAKTEFEIGAKTNPGSHNPEHERVRTLAKIEQGAHFLVTRPAYEATGVERVVEAVDGRAPIYVTIAPLTDFDRADFLAHEVPDVVIPDSTLDVLRRAGRDADRAGLELAAQLVAQLQPHVSGVVLAPRTDVVASVRTLLAAL